MSFVKHIVLSLHTKSQQVLNIVHVYYSHFKIIAVHNIAQHGNKIHEIKNGIIHLY